MWPIILNFDRATQVSLIQNESYQPCLEKTKNNGEHERQYLSLLSSFINAIDSGGSSGKITCLKWAIYYYCYCY